VVRRLVLALVSTVTVVTGLFVANLAAGNSPSLGLDLQGGASVTLEPVGRYESGALDVAVDIIRQRVDSIGVAEPEIIRQGDTVIVNLPGVKDQQRALELVGRTGRVEMRPVLNVVEDPSLTTPTSTTAPATSTTLADPSGGLGSSMGTPRQDDGGVQPGLRPGETILPGAKDGLLYLLGQVGATGEVFSNDTSIEVDGGGFAVVANLRGGAAGADAWNALATLCYAGGEQCPTRSVAIILDDEVLSAPVVQTPNFSGGQVQITGDFTRGEAEDLARVLQFGAVPVEFEAPTVQTVSATLGKDSLRAALIAGGIGVLLVVLFLLLYYRALALVIVVGIVLSGLLLWSTISWLSKVQGLALTLSGAAGIIVSVGVTIDSYILFYEKLKDDVRSGRSLRNSAARGFSRAWRTIVVADSVSLIGAVILWWLTVGSVRGFAFFLGLSTLADMLISYTFSRPAVLLLSRTRRFGGEKVFGVRARTLEASA
jgi:preprotein translocase subunit SecD